MCRPFQLRNFFLVFLDLITVFLHLLWLPVNQISLNGEYIAIGDPWIFSFHRIDDLSPNQEPIFTLSGSNIITFTPGLFGFVVFEQEDKSFWTFSSDQTLRRYDISDIEQPKLIENFTSPLLNYFKHNTFLIFSPFEENTFYFGGRTEERTNASSTILQYRMCEPKPDEIIPDEPNVGAIVGGVVGSIVGVALLASFAVVFYVWLRRKRRRDFMEQVSYSVDDVELEVNDEWRIPFGELEMKESIGKGVYPPSTLTVKELTEKSFELNGAMQMWLWNKLMEKMWINWKEFDERLPPWGNNTFWSWHLQEDETSSKCL